MKYHDERHSCQYMCVYVDIGVYKTYLVRRANQIGSDRNEQLCYYNYYPDIIRIIRIII